MKALILEDASEISRLLTPPLRELCDEVATVESLAELDQYRALMHRCPDLLWFDLRLADTPIAETYEKIRVVREHCPDSVIVVMTGMWNPNGEEVALAAGADAFQQKPFAVTPREVAELIAKAANRAISRGANAARLLENAVSVLQKYVAHVTAAPAL